MNGERTMKGLSRVLLFAAGMLAAAALHAEPGFRYEVGTVTITDLGTLDGSTGSASRATDINDHGNIVGISDSFAGLGVRHAFFYSGGIFQDVGASEWSTTSEATGINNSDVVVGTLWEGSNRNHAFRWSGGVLTRLNDILWSDPWRWLRQMNSEAFAISDTGYIAGARYETGGYAEGDIWTDAANFQLLDSDITGYGNLLFDINGEYVVGIRRSLDDRRWRFNPSVFPAPSVVIPGTNPSVPRLNPLGVNRWGAVVGFVVITCTDGPNCNRAAYWNGVTANSQYLGIRATGTTSVAEDINDSGFIAGFANRLFPDWLNRVDAAFFYHRDFGMYELPRLATSSRNASCAALALNNIDANNRVQVVGSCQIGDGSTPAHAVRWDVTLRKRTPPCTTAACR
jgi:probable HAF family extracellular repeat protein